MTQNNEFSLEETIKNLEDNLKLQEKISKDLDEYEKNMGKMLL